MDLYESVAQQAWPYAIVAVRPRRKRSASARDSFHRRGIRSRTRRLQRSLDGSNHRGFMGSRRLSLTLVALFAALALVLATIGIYGVMSYVVAGRTQEIGIHIALGAQRRDIFKLVVGQGWHCRRGPCARTNRCRRRHSISRFAVVPRESD